MTPLEYDPQTFVHVDTQDAMQDMFAKVKGFHDAMIRRLDWMTEDEVRQDLGLYYGNRNAVHMLIHSQFASCPVVEILGVNVDILCLRPNWELMGFGIVEERRVILSFEGEILPRLVDTLHFGLMCEQLYYRLGELTLLKPGLDPSPPIW